MPRFAALRSTILEGRFYSNIDFRTLCRFMTHLGFSVRIRGSHHIFVMDGIDEIINLQAKGSKAKPYQVKQVRQILIKYRLGDKDVS